MIKMAVFDMDGTLLDDQHEISEANRLALLELRERGCLIVLATGRPKPLLREYIEKLKVCDYVISCNCAILE